MTLGSLFAIFEPWILALTWAGPGLFKYTRYTIDEMLSFLQCRKIQEGMSAKGSKTTFPNCKQQKHISEKNSGKKFHSADNDKTLCSHKKSKGLLGVVVLR